MRVADRTAAKCRSREGNRCLIAAQLARKFILFAVLAVCANPVGLRCSNPQMGGSSLWNYSCTWFDLASAADDESEAEKQAREREREEAKQEQEREREAAKKEQEREREAAKKEQEREREAAKKEQEQERESAKKEQEQEREEAKKEQEQERESAKKEQERESEQEKQALEREFEQSKKSLEQSNASEKDKKDLEERYERDKEALESGDRGIKQKPAATVVEFLRRKLKSRSRKPNEKKQEPRAQKRTKKPSIRSVGRRDAAKTSFRTGEVLAINPGVKGRLAAQKLGFRILSSTEIPGLRGRVVRLKTPPGVDTRSARELLRREIPTGGIELNKKYRVYHAAKEPKAPVKPGKAAKLPPSRDRSRSVRRARSADYACEADHCFSRSVLRWKSELESCSGGVRIGIIDTNVDLAHRTFQGQRIKVGNFIPTDRGASSDSHGTAVASILAGSRNSSTPGLVPSAEFFAANIFYTDENGEPATDTLTLLKALDWLDAWDVQLVNMSFVGPEDQLIHDALQRMSLKHMIFVAATGNEGPAAPPRYPAAYPEVVAVTAVNSQLRNYRLANRGPFVDVAAPGVNIWTALPDNREGYHSGTSFAAPHVTALLATIYKDRAKERTRDQLMSHLPVRDLGPEGRDPIYGRGLVVAPPDCHGSEPLTDPIAWATKSSPNKRTASPAALGSALSLSSGRQRRRAPESVLSLDGKHRASTNRGRSRRR